ncbi:MAG TPA: histidine phosphatase family protein [Cyclobacteriaceae bacterium]|nr:histidine phosphatase family protein [Cyclobacteriaceae bacterium]
MTSKKIYLIRHGQTEFNLNGIVQGSGIDSSLNAFGVEQANSFYNTYQHISFDKVYTSTLKRSVQSVSSFIDKGIVHESYEGLNEINWGNKEGTKITQEEDDYYRWLLKQWQNNKISLRIEGGESPEDVAARQRSVLNTILNRAEEQTILICMHGRAIRVLLCQLLNYPLSAMDIFEHNNLCLYQLNYTGSMCTVELFNNVDHLKHLNSVPIER